MFVNFIFLEDRTMARITDRKDVDLLSSVLMDKVVKIQLMIDNSVFCTVTCRVRLAGRMPR